VDIRNLVIEHKLRANYLEIIYDVLTLFVMIELLRSIAEYFNTRRLRMTFIVDRCHRVCAARGDDQYFRAQDRPG